MGCSQSKTRSEPVQAAPQTAPVTAPRAVSASPVRAAVEPKAETPKVIETPKATDDEPMMNEVAPAADVNATPAALEAPEAQQEKQPEPIVEVAAPNDTTTTAAEAPAPQHADTPSTPLATSTPTIPALAVPSFVSAATTVGGARRKTPVRSRRNSTTNAGATVSKENAGAAAKKTPTRSKTPKRTGLGVAAVNTTAARKVTFDAVPPPVDTAKAGIAKARKAAGKHGGNVNEELFLASISAFERQLTHRSTLDKQLNSR